MILLATLLLGSTSALSDQGLAKRVLKGDKVSFDGTLLNDEALRQIDLDLIEKDMCEQRLYECNPSQSVWGWPEFFTGVLAGSVAYWALSH